jgi:O-acetyl-ADP-ribose deacetylase (regulator of RNase III)
LFEGYRRRCKSTPPEFELGDAFLWRENGKPAVINLGNQPRLGRGATYPVVEQALRAMRETADRDGLTSIAVPRIAAGYGGLSGKKVRAVIEAVFGDWPGTLFVYEEFKTGA